PAVEEQATDRSYRIGQTRPFQVHRQTSEGTIEEHIARMIESKRELADAVLGAGGVEGAISELSTADLAELVSLRSTEGDALSAEGDAASTEGDRTPAEGDAPSTEGARRTPGGDERRRP
ncbi:MAG: ATP-dependent helicase, partial [Oerskovia sp.]|nr:ATP-dependent helicase [Oerskovia sp.]